MYKHILLPTDGSAASTRAVDAGLALAKAVGARVTGFHAAPPAVPFVFGKALAEAYMSPGERAAAIEQATGRYLSAIERAAARAGVPCETVHVTSDFPADAILEAARKRKGHGLARPPRRRGRAARQRDAEGADALEDPGAGASLSAAAEGQARRARRRARLGTENGSVPLQRERCVMPKSIANRSERRAGINASAAPNATIEDPTLRARWRGRST